MKLNERWKGRELDDFPITSEDVDNRKSPKKDDRRRYNVKAKILSDDLITQQGEVRRKTMPRKTFARF